MNTGSITIATPFLNEEASLEVYFVRINEVYQTLQQKGWQVSLLLINDGSQDRTADMLHEYAKTHPGTMLVSHPQNLGYGASIKTALSVATTDWVVFVDADTNYDQRLILKIADHLDEHVDMVNVSILAPQGRAGYRWYRYLISSVVSQCYKSFFPFLTKNIYTMTCGFRAYRRSVVPQIFPINDGFVATSEIMIRALKSKLRVLEFPASNARREQGKSKMRFIKTVYDHLRFIVKTFLGQLPPPASMDAHRARILQGFSD